MSMVEKHHLQIFKKFIPYHKKDTITYKCDNVLIVYYIKACHLP